MKKLLRPLIWIYLIACILAIVLVPPTRDDWWGIVRHPHGGVPGLILSLPWSLALRFLHYHGTAYTTALVLFAMAMNAFLLESLRRRLRASGDASSL